MIDKEQENKQKVESILYDFPENYPGKERKEKIDKLENLSDEESLEELDKIVSKNDEVMEKDYLSSVVKQKEETLVYFEVENIYSDPEKRAFRNRLKMRRNPPILVIKDDNGQEVKFKLTENLTDELTETLKQVKRAYFGFSGPSDINKPGTKLEKVKFYLNKNKIKLAFLTLIISFLFYIKIKMGG